MRNLKILTVQPSDLLYIWTLRVQLTNFKKHGILKEHEYQALIWIPYNRVGLSRGVPDGWMELVTDFPEVKFFFYYDEENYIRTIQAFGYIPLLRPHCVKKHFANYPELEKDAIFYTDADVLFTKPLDFSPFLKDDVNYVSQAGSYINADYFDSKAKDVLPEKQAAYAKIDVLESLATQLGVSRAICEANNNNSGAAQYLLKNIDAKFWADVEDACMIINVHLQDINKKYFENENKGFQRWCADIWGVLWNLWKREAKTLCPKEMDFAWATDVIDKWDEVYIYHDAGAGKGTNLFDKRKTSYINNVNTPFDEEEQAYLDGTSPHYCSYKYVEAIKEAKNFKI